MKKMIVIILLLSSICFGQSELTLIMLAGADEEAMQEVVAAYEAQADTTITIESYPFDQFFQVAELRLQSQDAIDLVYVDAPLVASYASRDFLNPLPINDAETTWTGAAIASGTFRGELVAAPLNSSTQVMYFNRMLFEKHGLEMPAGIVPGESYSQEVVNQIASEQRWNWDQVVEAAQALTESEGGRTEVWGFSFEQPGNLYQLQPIGSSKGSAILSPDGLEIDGHLNSAPWA